ncbi:MAG: stage III sporulation protein AG [Oscillospiraceae bacterium]|jgi:stage III sporulation protein AG|nr:stage III sporulation protein AG [Oscillospiraceae bacterium]
MKDKISNLLKRGGGVGFAVIIIVFGVLLLLLPTGEKKAAPPEAIPITSEEFNLEELEARIARALSQIHGAGRVSVVLTLKTDGYTELATDKSYSERRENGELTERGQSEENVVVGAGSSNQTPVITRRGYPEFQGALIVADGGEDATVRLAITQAVSALTGLGSDKVTVAKMRSGN